MPFTASCLLLMMTAVLGQAADAPKLDEKQLVKLLEPYDLEQAAKYEFFLDEKRQQKLELAEKPVMRWTADVITEPCGSGLDRDERKSSGASARM